MAGAKRTGQSTVTSVMKPSIPAIQIAIKRKPVMWLSLLESAHARSLAAALPLGGGIAIQPVSFAHDVDRPSLHLLIGPTEVFADYAERQQLQAAQE